MTTKPRKIVCCTKKRLSHFSLFDSTNAIYVVEVKKSVIPILYTFVQFLKTVSYQNKSPRGVL